MSEAELNAQVLATGTQYDANPTDIERMYEYALALKAWAEQCDEQRALRHALSMIHGYQILCPVSPT